VTESAQRLTAEQIADALPLLSVDELHEVGKAVAKDASRRLRNNDE
jgi:hypothetical protein